MEHHVKTHVAQKEFSCEFCSKAFDRKRRLDLHVARVHTKPGNAICDVCGKSFSDRVSRLAFLHITSAIYKMYDNF